MSKKVILSCDNKYSIDEYGNVYNNLTGYVLRGTTIDKKHRYQKVHLGKKFYNTHLLVLETFVGPRPTPKHTANHKDGNRYNNSLSNLEWCTHAENVRHSRDMHLHRGQYGEEIVGSKLTEEQAKRVWALKDSPLTARQIRDRLGLQFVSVAAIKAIRRGKAWARVIQGTIPEKHSPTPNIPPREVWNKIITDSERELIKSHMHLLTRWPDTRGVHGLTINQLLDRLGLSHIKGATAYQLVRQLRSMDCNDYPKGVGSSDSKH